MSCRKNSRRQNAHRQNTRRQNNAQRLGTEGALIAGYNAPLDRQRAPTHATMFFAPIPVAAPGAPVAAWLRISTRDALRIAACECGERVEERVQLTKPLRGGRDLQRFVGHVLANAGGVTSFASAHLGCAVAALDGPMMCRESFWGVPLTVPATVRFWADQILMRTLEERTADDRETVTVYVLTIDASGRERTSSREVSSRSMPAGVGVELWVRASMMRLIAECQGQLIGAMLVARDPNTARPGEEPPCVAMIATPQTRFSGLLAFERRHGEGRAAGPRLYDWQSMILPNGVFDGLFG